MSGQPGYSNHHRLVSNHPGQHCGLVHSACRTKHEHLSIRPTITSALSSVKTDDPEILARSDGRLNAERLNAEGSKIC